MHAAGVRTDARDVRAHRPRAGRQPPRPADLRAGRPRHGRREGRRRRASASTTRRSCGSSSASRRSSTPATSSRPPTARFELLLRKETGVYEPLFRLESWRVHRRAARRRQGRDRGDDQDLGRRRALRPHRRGQRPGQRARPRAARRDRRDPPAPRGHRARQLQGPHPRRDARAPTRSPACCSTRPTGTDTWGSIGVHENVIAASWQALVDSLEYGDAAGPPRRSAPSPSTSALDPGRPAGPRRARGGARPRGPALRAALARARRCRRSRRRFAARVGAAARQRGVERHRRPAPGAARGRRAATATRSSRRRSRSSPAPTRSLYERARPVFADIDPVTLNLDPEAARAAVTDRTTALLPVAHLRLPGRHRRRSRRSGLPIVEDACEALGAAYADGTPVGSRGHPAVFAFYANKQLTTGEGGIVVTGDAGGQGAHRLRAQPGPRAGHGLARPRPARLQLPPVGHRLRARHRPARAARRHARRPRAGSPRCYREALGRRSRASACRARTAAASGAAGSSSSSSSRDGRRPRRRRSARCASAASSPSPTCRRST